MIATTATAAEWLAEFDARMNALRRERRAATRAFNKTLAKVTAAEWSKHTDANDDSYTYYLHTSGVRVTRNYRNATYRWIVQGSAIDQTIYLTLWEAQTAVENEVAA